MTWEFEVIFRGNDAGHGAHAKVRHGQRDDVGIGRDRYCEATISTRRFIKRGGQGRQRKTIKQRVKAFAEIPPASLQILENVWSDAWHPATHLEAFAAAVVKVHGPETAEELAYRAMKDRFESIIMPMLKRSLETSNRSPAAILSRLGGLVEMGMRGLDILWEDEKQGGILQIKYPRGVTSTVDLSWRGVLRFVFEVTQSTAKIVEFFHSETRTTLQYKIVW